MAILASRHYQKGSRPRNGLSRGLAWIREVKDKRFFAWVHLYDPHAPYDPPEPYKSRYAGRPYDGEIAWTDELVGRLIGRHEDDAARIDEAVGASAIGMSMQAADALQPDGRPSLSHTRTVQ